MLSFFPKTKKPIISIFIGILFAITLSACSSDEEELFSKADVDATVEARLHQEQPPTATAIPTHTTSPVPTVIPTPDSPIISNRGTNSDRRYGFHTSE